MAHRLPPALVWAAVWSAAWAVPWVPAGPLALAVPGLWLSAALLAPGRPQGRRLVLAAAGFWLFWSLLLSLGHLLNPTSTLRPSLNLAAWLALGLNLVLGKTPLELALAAAGALSPVLGRVRAQKLALALALLTRLLPALLASALAVRVHLGRRAAHLPLTRRLAWWARAVLRESLGQSEDLARSLALRWPWP